jgi:hypothetical protein
MAMDKIQKKLEEMGERGKELRQKYLAEQKSNLNRLYVSQY